MSQLLKNGQTVRTQSGQACRVRSLLGAGLIGLDGEFQREDTVRICNIHGQEIARGLVNYTHKELQKIRGRRSDEISQILGYDGEETVVHRDNLVLTG